MAGFIKTGPCESCSAARTECETGAGFCAMYGLNFDECAEWREAGKLEAMAHRWANELRSTVNEDSKRRELAIATGDGFANALYVQGKGAEFDTDAFLEACGLALHEEAA